MPRVLLDQTRAARARSELPREASRGSRSSVRSVRLIQSITSDEGDNDSSSDAESVA